VVGPRFWRLHPNYLKADLPGDYEWDTAGMGFDPATLAAYGEAEAIHARWAMLRTLGCLTPELLYNYTGVDLPEPVCYTSGYQTYKEGGLDYPGNPGLVHAQSLLTILGAQGILMNLVETSLTADEDPLGKAADILQPAMSSLRGGWPLTLMV
jgi:Chlorophyll A-B binding protein.